MDNNEEVEEGVKRTLHPILAAIKTFIKSFFWRKDQLHFSDDDDDDDANDITTAIIIFFAIWTNMLVICCLTL